MAKIGYVLKVYPRFSETFVVTEILARENNGENLVIFALRQTTDSRFHPEIAKVTAPVKWIPRPLKPSEFWAQLTKDVLTADLGAKFVKIWPQVASLPADEVAQGVSLAVAAKQAGITHLHAHFASLAGRTAWIASKLSGIPYTVTTHAKDIFHSSVDAQWLQRIAEDATQVIAISQYNYRYLADKFAHTKVNLVLQYNAVELQRFPYSPKTNSQLENLGSRPLQVLAVGRLVEKKGFDLLLRALRDLLDKDIDLQVKIAGEGSEADRLQSLCEELDLLGRVEFLGAFTQAEVKELLHWADVHVTPSVPAADGNLDGLPTVVLEAMSLGTLVVASDVAGLPEVVYSPDTNERATGLLVPSGHVDPLTDALELVVKGKVDYLQLTQNARHLIETNFDSAKQAQQLKLLMDEAKTH